MDLLYLVPLQATPCHQKIRQIRQLPTGHIYGQFETASLLYWMGMSGWVLIIKLKADLSSTGTGLQLGLSLAINQVCGSPNQDFLKMESRKFAK